MHETTFTLSYQSETQATIVESALRPEVGDIDTDRTTATVTRSETDLELVVEATDPVALRAGQSTWLGLIEVVEAVTAAGRRFDGTVET